MAALNTGRTNSQRANPTRAPQSATTTDSPTNWAISPGRVPPITLRSATSLARIDARAVAKHREAFERAGLHAIPFPAPPDLPQSGRLDDYLPRSGALEASYHALHEAIGLFYYRLRY